MFPVSDLISTTVLVRSAPAIFRRIRGQRWGLRLGLLAAVAAVPVAAVPPPGYEPIDDGHVDFRFCFNGGTWTYGLVWHQAGDPLNGGPAPGVLRPPELSVLVANDRPYPAGSRIRRPAAPSDDPGRWDFLGVDEGAAMWFFPQGNVGGLWPGFNVCDDGCDSYFEEDPRVHATSTWRLLRLTNLRYIGKGNGHFSQWTSAPNGGVTVWVSSIDGVTGQDAFYIGGAGHAHLNTGFSALGLYEASFSMTCFTGPGKTNPVTSPEVPFYYAVGTYWKWISTHFTPDRWWEQSMIGEQDDPDGDGVPNLLEYACGLNPREADAQAYDADLARGLPSLVLEPGSRQGTLKLPRRTEATFSQLDYVLQHAPDLVGPWSGPLDAVATPRIEGWDELSLPILLQGQGFFRLGVSLRPEMNYPEP
jgi:hypothetical protein